MPSISRRSTAFSAFCEWMFTRQRTACRQGDRLDCPAGGVFGEHQPRANVASSMLAERPCVEWSWTNSQNDRSLGTPPRRIVVRRASAIGRQLDDIVHAPASEREHWRTRAAPGPPGSASATASNGRPQVSTVADVAPSGRQPPPPSTARFSRPAFSQSNCSTEKRRRRWRRLHVC